MKDLDKKVALVAISRVINGVHQGYVTDTHIESAIDALYALGLIPRPAYNQAVGRNNPGRETALHAKHRETGQCLKPDDIYQIMDGGVSVSPVAGTAAEQRLDKIEAALATADSLARQRIANLDGTASHLSDRIDSLAKAFADLSATPAPTPGIAIVATRLRKLEEAVDKLDRQQVAHLLTGNVNVLPVKLRERLEFLEKKSGDAEMAHGELRAKNAKQVDHFGGRIDALNKRLDAVDQRISERTAVVNQQLRDIRSQIAALRVTHGPAGQSIKNEIDDSRTGATLGGVRKDLVKPDGNIESKLFDVLLNSIPSTVSVRGIGNVLATNGYTVVKR